MMINGFYTAYSYGVSFKTLDRVFAGQKLLDTAADLVVTLESVKSVPKNIEDLPEKLNELFKTDEQKAQATLDDLIKNSIKEITEIRKSLSITQAAGQNKPLNELFQSIKGAVFDGSF